MYLLADEKAVQAYNSTEYASKYQREMTVAEYVEGTFLYHNAKTFLKEFIGLDWTIPNIEKLLSKVRHTNNMELLDRTLTATQIVNDTWSQYIDIFVNGNNGSSILITVLAHNVTDDVVGKIHLSDYFNQDISGLDYTYEDISPIAPCFVITNEDITKGNALDKMYKK